MAESSSFLQRKFKPDDQDLREETIIETIMAEPLLEIIEYQAEKDTEKKYKPVTPVPVSIEELTKNIS